MFRELHKLYLRHACKEYLDNWPDLVKYCGYREDNIPQLQDISTYLKSMFDSTTWTRHAVGRSPEQTAST